MTSRCRTWSPGRPVPLGAILGTSRRGPGDPTYRIGAGGEHWRGLRTPEGVVTLRLVPRNEDGGVEGTAWGDGAAWVLDRLPTMLGDDDATGGFRPRHDFVDQALRHHPHWRIGASGLVMDALVPAALEQKVTGQEAFAGFRRLVRWYGEPAPGPGADRDLWVVPAAETVRQVPSWEWLRMPVDPARSRTVVQACIRAAALERTLDDPGEVADRKLRSVPGIGVWTSAEVRYRAHGDADALSVGDYHVAANVGWALVGEPFDDARMVEELEVYRGHRYRVQRLVELMGAYRPRRGPRMAPRRHLPGSRGR